MIGLHLRRQNKRIRAPSSSGHGTHGSITAAPLRSAFSLISCGWCISPRRLPVSFAAVRSRDHASPICLTLTGIGRSMKDLLAIVGPVFESKLDWSVDYGLDLAHLVGAHFTALIADIEIEPLRRQVAPNGPRSGVEPAGSASAASDIVETAALIKAAAANVDVSCCVLSHESASCSLRETLIENAQVRDLVLLDVCEPLRYPRKGLVEAVLFNTGRPIVLVPANVQCAGIRGALIAWDGTPSAVRALHDALPLLAYARGIVLVTVSGDKDFRHLRSGTEFCRYLARWDLVARAETIERRQRTVGAALLEYAREIDAGLLIMGGFGHAKEREFIYGSATRDIIQSTPDIPVLLSH